MEAVFAPPGTLNDDGSDTLGESALSATARPPAGAGPFNDTPIVTFAPPRASDGEALIATGIGGSIVINAVWVFSAAVAEINTCVSMFTAAVVIDTDPCVRPAPIVIVAGTVTTELFDVRLTVTSPC